MRLLDTVALVVDVPAFNLYRGQVGTIVEVYEPGVFEVEFSDLEGRTCTLETLKASQLMVLRCTATGNSGHSLRQDYGIISIYLKGVSDGETQTKKLHARV